MHLPADISSLPLYALYAETHFRFSRLFPSLLFMRQPEVIFDAPRRLAPGEDLPVLLIANDLHRFPARFSDCAVAVAAAGGLPQRFDFSNLDPYEVAHPMQTIMRAFLLRIPRGALPSGTVSLTCRVTMTCGKKQTIVINDNLRTTKKMSFSCYVAGDALPGSEWCGYGDLHMHSQFSQSHVEFGPPVAVIGAVARASGLSFAAITDHSYDLACSMDDFLSPDPESGRWRAFQKEMAVSGSGVLIIAGEEVSCLNAKSEVVHCAGLGLRECLPGTLDGARKNRKRDRQLDLPEAVAAIHSQGGIAFAAHPGVRPPFMQRWLLYRGEWSGADLAQDLDGLQIFNNGITPSFHRAKKLWVELLQKGHRLPLLSGNDAHGDFNRYRFLAAPFLSIGENADRYMGCGKTGIYGNRSSVEELLDGVRDGATFITTGPYAAICSSSSPEDSIVGKSAVAGDGATLFVHAISTPEFGSVRTMEVFAGLRNGSSEKSIFHRQCSGAEYRVGEKIEMNGLPFKPAYVRAEVSCGAAGNGAASSCALTSAVFFD